MVVATGYQPFTRTVQQVVSRVQRAFGDESGVQVTLSDIIGWINDGQRDIAEREHILKGKATQSTVVGQSDYRWPNIGILSVDSLHFNGLKIDNVPFAQAEADYVGGNDSGDPQVWYEWGGQFSFYPTPSTVGTIDIFFSQTPATVANTTDLLTVPDKYFNAVVHYCLQQAYEMDEDWTASQAKQQEYQDSLNSIGDDERDAAQMTGETITRLVEW